tara:strand:+ start:123 stop:866 length:744 start_codon:yes stop_codon:yes gene_type:complete
MSENKKISFKKYIEATSKILKERGLEIVQKKKLLDYYLHKYDSYEQYKEAQIKLNKKKLNLVWADEKTLKKVADIIKEAISEQNEEKNKIFGICHGARNGFEQKFLKSEIPNSDIIGTDISETVLEFEDSVHWDFHDEKKEWLEKFDFVYSNSLDQSWKPKLALSSWLNQIKLNGLIILEHSIYHSPEHADEGDPFGVRPTVMPYILTDWFGHQISVSHCILEKKNVFSSNIKVWLFIIKKISNVKF